MSKPKVTVSIEGQKLDAEGRKTSLYYGTLVLEGFSEVIKWKQERYSNPRQYDKELMLAAESMEADGYDGDLRDDAAAMSTWKRVKTEPRVNKAVRNLISEPLALADNVQHCAESHCDLYTEREVERLRAKATAKGWTINLDQKAIEQQRVEARKREQEDIFLEDVLGPRAGNVA